MITLFCLNFLVAVEAYIAATSLLSFKKPVDVFISAFTIYLAQVIAVELFLGLLGTLYLRDMAAVHLVLFAWVWHRAKAKDFSFSLQFKPNRVVWFAFCAVCGFSFAKLTTNLMNFPFGWDSLNYHFTFAVEWFKQGNLNIPITIADDPSPSYYPINGSLFYLWLMMPLKNVFIADLGQFPFFVAAAVSLYAIARKIGLTSEEGVYASVLFLLIPNYFKQLEVAYVDVMVAALFFISTYLLLLLKEEFSLRNNLLFGASMGLLIGTKTIALPYAFLLFIPFIVLACKSLNRVRLSFAAILLLVIFGGFSYVRNLIDAANPLYPLDFYLFGKRIFKGVMDTRTYAAHFKISDYRLDKLLFHEGLGAQTLLFVLPGMLLGALLAFWRKSKDLSVFRIYYLLLPLSIYCIYRFVIPLANARYLYPALGLGIIFGFYCAKLMHLPLKILRILVCLCVISSIAELSGRLELAASFIVTAALFLLYPYFRVWLPKVRLGLISFILLSLLAIFIPLEQIYLKTEFEGIGKMRKYSGYESDVTSAWLWLNQNTKGANIAYTGRPLPFPLYGTGFKNNVYYVSVNATEPAKLDYFPDGRYRWGYGFLGEHENFLKRGNYRENADFKEWFKNLRNRQTGLLFIYSLHQVDEIIFPLEDIWARSHPDKFSLVFSNNTVRIYKVRLI